MSSNGQCNLCKLLAADVIKIALQCHLVKRRYGKREEEADPPIEDGKSGLECSIDLFWRTLNGSRIRHAPVRSHGLTWPKRANFVSSVVANGKHEIELRRIRTGKLIP